LRSNNITSKFIKACHHNGILALAWDFLSCANPIEKIRRLIEIGIDGILFDDLKNIKVIKNW